MNSTMIKSTSQIKKKFSKESHVFINDFQNRISELDSTLPNFSKQIDGLISIYELLQNSAIEANFYTPQPAFSEIIHHFEESISLLSYQHFGVDWITKGLLFEAINMMSQIIDEYCFDKASNQDWIKLQDNLFKQLTEHFRQKTDQLPDQLLEESSDELTILQGDENEPFNLTDASEEFHLFDVDFESENQVLAENSTQELNQLSNHDQQFETSNGFVLIELDDQQQPDSSSELVKELSDIFDVNTSLDEFVNHTDNNHAANNYSVNNFFGDEDETELLGTNWDEEEISIEDDVDNTLVDFSSLNSWGEMDADDALAIAQLEAGFEVSEELDNSECRIDFALSSIDEQLQDNKNISWESLVLTSIESANNSSQSDLLMVEQLGISKHIYESELSPTSIPTAIPTEIHLDNTKDHDFLTSDIDTAIEMSPIYRNDTSEFKSAWINPSLTSFSRDSELDADQKLDYALNSYGEDVDTQVNAFSSMDYELTSSASKKNSIIDLNIDSRLDSNLDSNLDIIDEQFLTLPYETENNAVIRIPLHHVTKLGDLSEDLLVRNGSLNVYLDEMRKLARDVQQSLQTLHPDVLENTLQNTLQNTVMQMVSILEKAEKQTSAINHDVQHLRKNLGQVLRQPISSLLSRFPRILHGLSLQYGKQVELLVQGAEVGLERAIADVVMEPLDLLIRNAFEYGIESPSDRLRQGKLPQGKIEIIAVQTEENTVIRVCDDGRGLANIAHIEENNAELSDLRKSFQNIGGTVSVQSELGKDTQYTIILPNTLSLVRVLLIEINQVCLAIPSKAILEVRPIAPSSNLNNNLANTENQETLLWRDRQIPIVRLNSFFKLNCRTDNYKPANAVPSYLVIQHEDNLLALSVDGCWHDQDATFHHIEGDIDLSDIFAGTVILGNDQAIALVDLTELVNQVRSSSLNNPLNTNLSVKASFNSLADDEMQIARISESDPFNLNSLAAFFDAGDSPDANFFDMTEPSDPLLEKQPSHQPKVLIVESSANIRRYLSMTLVRAGFLTEQASNGQDAIAFLKKSIKNNSNSNSSIDIVITDLDMPQMNGFKLLTNIRADADLQNLPVVVLASHDNENDRKLALDLGANAYFSKPYHEQELMTALQQMVI